MYGAVKVDNATAATASENTDYSDMPECLVIGAKSSHLEVLEEVHGHNLSFNSDEAVTERIPALHADTDGMNSVTHGLTAKNIQLEPTETRNNVLLPRKVRERTSRPVALALHLLSPVMKVDPRTPFVVSQAWAAPSPSLSMGGNERRQLELTNKKY